MRAIKKTHTNSATVEFCFYFVYKFLVMSMLSIKLDEKYFA